MRWTVWVPLLLFAFFLGLAGYQLFQPKDEFIPSTMIGRPLPEFQLEPASETRPGVSLTDFKDGKPRLLNIWASWCLPCKAEAPHLEALNKAGVEIVGVAIRDKREDVDRFLAEHGNPYTRIGVDDISAIQLEIGSSGVPETFVIDGKGIIRYQHIGDVRAENVPELLAKLEEAAQ
ncbi:DsbE family thiol:disulfide interchange protein [Altererythrobacter sp. BO-6]|uniref:DsbE family thiol:disulfide interchange protein n=1 Tax=Altererythrobacter sp. BO-6 TaxID=2604537 RepID=UPI0013E0FAD5|nr:DsbE family thiol:disulfide interchange protein [Altererythrobacter sp. BO-6]QIG53231.1 DsbE family thiol:disulfide interchange protein [Altererythrobacter sp. BO-6]